MTLLAPSPEARLAIEAACATLEEGRSEARQHLTLSVVGGLVAVTGAMFFSPEHVPLITFGAVGFIVAVAWLLGSRLTSDYKLALATAIVPSLRPGLAFRATGSIDRRGFNALGLFDRQADRATACDEISGDRNGVRFAIQELQATYTTTSGSGKKRRRTTHSIFQGSAVTLEFNKHFHGHTIVIPEYLGSGFLSGLFGGSSGGGMEPVTLEDAEFERAFVVRSSDQQEARYLLTLRFMELVLEARARLGWDLRLAFQGNMLWVLVAGTEDRFEASLFSAKSPADALEEISAVIALADGLVTTLDLETRIWTRV